ncbi:MAG TPA: Ku protein [Solirubrobacteraceae bacterium]|jgi:DNA end-binding protein Ku
MRFADELVDPGRLTPSKAKRAPTKREIDMAGRLVGSLHADFHADAFDDDYRDRVHELIAAKARGETPDVKPEQSPGKQADLAAALEASLPGAGADGALAGTGSLSFGLVNVPVALVSGVRDLKLHFHELHEKDGARIAVQRWCPRHRAEVPIEEVAHSYETDDGETVVVSDLELDAVAPQRTRTIEIEQFVDIADVDPVLFDHPYFLIPVGDDDGTLRAYALLTEVMARSDRAPLGRFVMRAKEYLVIVRAQDDVMSLTTMRFGDEIRNADGIDTASGKASQPKSRELEAATAVIQELTADWEPERFKDRYRQRL